MDRAARSPPWPPRRSRPPAGPPRPARGSYAPPPLSSGSTGDGFQLRLILSSPSPSTIVTTVAILRPPSCASPAAACSPCPACMARSRTGPARYSGRRRSPAAASRTSCTASPARTAGCSRTRSAGFVNCLICLLLDSCKLSQAVSSCRLVGSIKLLR